ncbi:hypothetical protein B0J14DRAFT_201165 [Halenospora varia]|nr:hypothetical protein B0J14DRAFT_201165 [Halenospora varia]
MSSVAIEASEGTALLGEESPSTGTTRNDENSHYEGPAQHKGNFPVSVSPVRLLPIALFAALAMAATAATQVYTYATLLCRDPQHCEAVEQHNFAGAVAATTSVANICSLLALGSFERASRRSHKKGLATWLIVRAMSVGALALGLFLRNIVVALSCQIFEGFASDNILHFNLNAIYVQTPNQRDVSRLIGASLALYMLGISVSPSIAGLLSNFQASFVMASILFAIAFFYLMFGVQTFDQGPKGAEETASTNGDAQKKAKERSIFRSRILSMIWTIFSPLLFFADHPWSLPVGLSLFVYNSIQSYVFSAIMVHTTVKFGFSSRENGFVLSIAHAIASTYLLSTLFAGPYILRLVFSQKKRRNGADSVNRKSAPLSDAAFAQLSLVMQCLSLILFGYAQQPWHVYVITTMLALGLATPSFLKSYFVALFPRSNGPGAVAALASMETIGSLIAPVIFGGLQTIWPGSKVFFVAASGVGCANALLAMGMLVGYLRKAS